MSSTRELTGAVAVITGASSGIGRATAREFARRGTHVALAARRTGPLEQVAAECRSHGVNALAVPTDVTDPEAMQALARAAVERFGHFDVWVNNAGVYALGRVDDMPLEAIRRVIDVDLMGCFHGTRAALGHFRARKTGVIINVSSMLGALGAPYLAAYSAAKWGVRGLTQSVRQELLDLPLVDACAVLPASIDTPIFEHAGNWTGRALKALPPAYPPEKVAKRIVKLAWKPKARTVVGGAARLTVMQHLLAPRLTERTLATQVEKTHFTEGDQPPTSGNLFEPIEHGTGETGDWRRERRVRRAAVAACGAGAAAVAVAAGMRAARR